ncbi:MAG: hypothetical protein AAB578_03945 [Elusimicrobiota bacterium]
MSHPFTRLSACAALLAVAVLGASSPAQDEPAKEEPPRKKAALLPGMEERPKQAAETPVQEADKKPAQGAPEGAPPEPKTDCPEPAKPEERKLEGCSARFQTLADGYREAHESMRKWMYEASDKAAAVAKREAVLQEKIQRNEAAMTRLKLEWSKEAKAKLKELARENKELWRELEGVRKERKVLCRGLYTAAEQKVKELSAQMKERLGKVEDGSE